jgi:anti-anti-sigma regulatory factor
VDAWNPNAYVEGDDLVVDLRGDIDYQVGRYLHDELHGLAETAGRRRFVIDLVRCSSSIRPRCAR